MTTHEDTGYPLWNDRLRDADATAERPAVRAELAETPGPVDAPRHARPQVSTPVPQVGAPAPSELVPSESVPAEPVPAGPAASGWAETTYPSGWVETPTGPEQPGQPTGRVYEVPQSPGPATLLSPGTHAAGVPSWWQRSHPVFTPLVAFFTGLLTVIVVPIGYGAVLTQLFGDDKVKGLLPYGALVVLVPIVLLVPRRTRRFGRYMLFGMVSVAIVVLGVAALTVLYLYKHDG